MSRKKRVFENKNTNNKETICTDAILSKFINCLMYDGKKSIAERVVYDCFQLIKKETLREPLEVFQNAISNVMPVIQVMSIRIAGSNYQVPTEIIPHKQMILSIKWIIDSAKKRSEKTMAERLSKEFADAARNTGKSIEKKQTVHKMAEANRAYAHYRW